MLKKLSKKTSFILIGIVVGLFVGVSIKQAFGGTDTATVDQRNGNLAVNIANTYQNGLLVPYGNVGIGTITPSVKLEVTGNIKSTGLCIGITCIDENQLKAILGTGTTGTTSQTGGSSTSASSASQTGSLPTSYNLSVIKAGTGTGTVVSAPAGINCGSACAYTFSRGTSITLTETTASGSTFTGWSDACTGTATTCTVGMSTANNVRATFTSGTGTQSPPPPTCTGSHPATGNGVVLYDYTTVAVSGGGTSSNTVWQYGQASCGWGCTAPMTRDGDNGCKKPTPGSGATITLKDLSIFNGGVGGVGTGVGIKNISLSPMTMIGLTGLSASGFGGTNGIFKTDNNGVTPEFWLSGDGSAAQWTVVVVNVPGYKIRSTVGCTSSVEVWSGTTLNRCLGMKNGTPVTINMVPGDISTLPTIHFDTLTYHRGETLKGSISGGDPNNTWACMDSPSTQSGHECNSGRTDVWRKLTVPYDNHADGWQLVSTDNGDTLQLGGLLIEQGFPLGTYTQYVKTGQWGTQMTSKSITVVLYR